MTQRGLVADGLVTVREAAEWLGLGRAKLYKMMEQGELAYVKIGSPVGWPPPADFPSTPIGPRAPAQ
jgi:excisionase family DNA binding protein